MDLKNHACPVSLMWNLFITGSVHGRWVRVEQSITFVRGINELALLSETVGLQVFSFAEYLLLFILPPNNLRVLGTWTLNYDPCDYK